MNSTEVSQNSHHNRSRPFGFGYEAKSSDNSSVQAARAEFLTVILENKPQVVFSLFAACYLPFSQLLERCKDTISEICAEIDAEIPKESYILRQPKFIRERALKRLLPNYRYVVEMEGAAALCRALAGWSREHNLTDDWCLDDALEVLRAFEVADEKRMALALLPDVHFLRDVWKRSWQSAAVERRFVGLHQGFQSNVAVEERDALMFRFRYETLHFELSGPFNKSIAAFRQEVEVQFKSVGGPTIRGARKHLDYSLRKYFAKVEKVRSELDLKAPPRWRKADEFLRRLVDYQLPPCKTYRQVARDVKRDDRTVSEGIQRIASLIGLTLRSNEADKFLGRPKGARDKKPRRRVDRRREKCGGTETNIS